MVSRGVGGMEMLKVLPEIDTHPHAHTQLGMKAVGIL